MQDAIIKEPHTCKNCDNQFEGIVCNICGQKVKSFSNTPKDLLREWWAARKEDIYHFLFTTRELLLRPGLVLEEYLDGKRKKYYNSTNYFLLIASLVTFVTLQFREVDAVKALEKWNSIYEKMGITMPDKNPAGLMTFEWISTHYNVAMMITLPFLAMASFWVFKTFFRKRTYKFGDHFVMHLFIYGLISFILIPTLPFIDPGDPNSPGILWTWVFLLIVYTWVYKSWLKINWAKAILGSILSYFFYFVFFFLFIIGIVIVAILLTIAVIFVIKLF